MQEERITNKIVGEPQKKRQRIDRSQGMNREEFKRLSIEEKLSHAKKWDGKTSKFDEAKQYQFSYEEFCRLLLEEGIANVSRIGWMYISELDANADKGSASEKGIRTIAVDARSNIKREARSVRFSKESWDKWDAAMEGCGAKNAFMEGIICEFLDEYEARRVNIDTKFI